MLITRNCTCINNSWRKVLKQHLDIILITKVSPSETLPSPHLGPSGITTSIASPPIHPVASSTLSITLSLPDPPTQPPRLAASPGRAGRR